MLCRASPEPPPLVSAEWIYELKLDGTRLIATKDERGACLHHRRLHVVNVAYPEIAHAVASLNVARVVLDGEVVAFDEQGRPSFARLARRSHLGKAADVRFAMREVPLVYMVFDLLALGHYDLRALPFIVRKSLLKELLEGSEPALRALDHLVGDARPLLAFCEDHDLEGLVAKRAASTYQPGPRRSADWAKYKRQKDDEYVVVGYTLGEGSRRALGALELASYEGDRLVYRGRVGSGFEEQSIRLLLERLAPLRQDRPTIATIPGDERERVWVRPELVVSVRFMGYTEGGVLRMPVFRGLREDKAPRECTAVPPPEPR